MFEPDPALNRPFSCRPGCGACCIAPSISPVLPALPQGKPAGVACPHLTVEFLCALWEKPERPAFCGSFRADSEMCGKNREDAMAYLSDLEEKTRPE